MSSDLPGLIGNAVIDGKASDLIDAGYFLTQGFADWFGSSSQDAYRGTDGMKRALLVDDSPFFRNLLSPLLSVAGWEVTQQFLDPHLEAGFSDRLTVEIEFFVGVDQDADDRVSGGLDIERVGGCPFQVAVVLGSGQDHEEDQQVEGDVAHRHAGHVGTNGSALDLHGSLTSSRFTGRRQGTCTSRSSSISSVMIPPASSICEVTVFQKW